MPHPDIAEVLTLIEAIAIAKLDQRYWDHALIAGPGLITAGLAGLALTLPYGNLSLIVVAATVTGAGYGVCWAFLGQRPSGRFVWSSLVAVTGIGLLFVHEFRQHAARSDEIALGIGLTLIGMVGASAANVFQAREEIRRFPLFSMLAWSMAAGAVMNMAIAFAMTGPPVFDSRPGYWLGVFYLALPASVLTFSLYYPVVRKIGPAKAAYSSAIIPIIAMAFSTALEGYRWSPLAIAGALLAIGGMIAALRRDRVVAPPDAA